MRFPVLYEEDMDKLNGRAIIFIVCMLIVFLILIIRLFILQVIHYEYYNKSAENNYIREIRLPAERGYIYDRNHRLLVNNQPSFSIEVVREYVDDIDALLNKINDVVPIADMKSTKDKIKKAFFYQPVTVLSGLSFEQISYFFEHYLEFQGISIQNEPVRHYNVNESMSHIIGYLSKAATNAVDEDNNTVLVGDTIGVNGIEKVYDNLIRGKPGQLIAEIDRFGRTIHDLKRVPPTPGNDIYLSIDSELQDYTAQVFTGQIGSVVVMDANSGELIVLYSAPSYDLNKFVPYVDKDYYIKLLNDENNPLINRATEGTYPPGSTFKPFMAYAGLKESVINVNTRFFCSGSFKYGSRSYACWWHSGHGSENVVDAIEDSCDVFFYNTGLLLGVDNIYKYATLFGFGNASGIDLPHEKSGFVASKEWKQATKNEPWLPGETIISAIGQGYTISTPLQLARATSMIANGGIMYQPHLLVSSKNIASNEELEFNKTITAKVNMSESYLNLVRQGMRNVIYGATPTAPRARLPQEYNDYYYGGKTGTAQVVSLDIQKKYGNDIPYKYRDHALFTSILAKGDKKYVITLVVEHGVGGGRTAAPIARQIAMKMIELNYFNDRNNTNSTINVHTNNNINSSNLTVTRANSNGISNVVALANNNNNNNNNTIH